MYSASVVDRRLQFRKYCQGAQEVFRRSPADRGAGSALTELLPASHTHTQSELVVLFASLPLFELCTLTQLQVFAYLCRYVQVISLDILPSQE